MSIFLKMFNYSFKKESSRGFWEGRQEWGGGEDSREDRAEERVRKEDEEGGGKVIRR